MLRFLSIIFIFLPWAAFGQADRVLSITRTTERGDSVVYVNPAWRQSDSTVVIDCVEVTAGHLIWRTQRISDPALTTSHTIRLMPHSSLKDALQTYIPGIVFTPNAMGNNMRVRGLSSRYMLVLIDGVRMAPEGAGGNVNFDRMAYDEVASVSVTNGAEGALRGAVGGVISIETSTEPGARATVEAGSHGTVRANVSWGRKRGGDYLRVDASRASSAGFEGYFAGLPYTDWGAALKGRHLFGKKVWVSANARFFSHETFNRKNTLNTTHKLAHSLMAATNARIREGRHMVEINLNTDNYIDYDVLEQLKNRHRRQNRTSLYNLRAADRIDYERGSVNFGIDGSHESTYAASTLGSTPTSLSLTQGDAFVEGGHWLQDETVQLTAGGRYTQNSEFGGKFSPSMSLLWVPKWEHSGFRFSGGVSTAFRAPSIKELHYNFDHQGMFLILGNPSLKPERGVHSNLKAAYNYGHIDASVELFRNDITNKITQYYVAGVAQTELHYKNVGSATVQGVTAQVRYWWRGYSDYWSVSSTYTFCDAVDNATGHQLESNPRHSAVGSFLWITHLAHNNLQTEVNVRYTSALNTLSMLGTPTRVAAQTTFRAGVMYEWRWGLSAGARVENIGDRRSVLSPEGRTFMATLKYKL